MRAGQVEFEKVDHRPADTVQSDIHFQPSFEDRGFCHRADCLQLTQSDVDYSSGDGTTYREFQTIRQSVVHSNTMREGVDP